MKQIFLFDAPVQVMKEDTSEQTIRDIASKYDDDEPIFILNLDNIVTKVKMWRFLLPRVKIFYAMKCNDHPYVLKLLNALGTGFDCASKGEFKRMREMGVDPSRIIYAHTSKPVSHIESAAAHKIDLMTFDSRSELEKVKTVFPEARLVLRIKCEALVAQCPLGTKFGLPPPQARSILEVAKKLELNVVGVSFHVGSGCQEPQVFLRAIKEARTVFDIAKEMGFDFKLLDIGGGYPGDKGTSLDELAHYINTALDEHFPDPDEVEVIAEPGRYIVASAFSLITKVVSNQFNELEQEREPFEYHINDGLYGSFNCVPFDHQIVKPCLVEEPAAEERLYNSIIWGPTCDSFDQVMSDALLPKLNIGDKLIWHNMGAYTLVAASKFNGFDRSQTRMIISSHLWMNLEPIIEEHERTAIENWLEPVVPVEKPYRPFKSRNVQIYETTASIGTEYDQIRDIMKLDDKKKSERYC